jgi:predicted enzyme related to lactoylglutathione lyase
MPKLRSKPFLAGLLLSALLASGCSGPAPTRITDIELSDEPLIGKFVWHDLITDDVAAARRFYGGLFGWSFESTVHPDGGDYTLIRAGDRYVGGAVELEDPADADYSRWLGYLSVADVDRAVDLTEARGGRSIVGPRDLGEVGRAAAIRDPQGAVIGLLRSRYGDPVDASRRAPGTIVWNELLAADDVGAADFYSALAGLQRVDQPKKGGVYRVLRAQDSDRAGIMQRPSEEIEPFWLTHFAVADVDAAVERVTGLGGAVLLAPAPDLRDGRFAVVTDPAGAILALSEAAPEEEDER